jgi:hypothetical protein
MARTPEVSGLFLFWRIELMTRVTDTNRERNRNTENLALAKKTEPGVSIIRGRSAEEP